MFRLILSISEQKVTVCRFMDEIGSVVCNQAAAEQFYLQPVLGWLINRRHSRNPYLGLFVCLFVFIDLILRADSCMAWIIFPI